MIHCILLVFYLFWYLGIVELPWKLGFILLQNIYFTNIFNIISALNLELKKVQPFGTFNILIITVWVWSHVSLNIYP